MHIIFIEKSNLFFLIDELFGGEYIMAKSSSYEVPGAKEAMNRFKQEVASEVGINLKQGYNGDLTSKQAGTIGGNMVKKMIHQAESQMSNK